MASIYDMKPQFQNLLRPLVKRLAKSGISPNQVTTFAMIVSILTGILLMLFYENTYMLLVVPIVMFVRMALNAIDGMLAKEHHMMTPLGNVLNELGDVISDAFLFLPFAMMPGYSSVLVVSIVIVSVISEMAGVLGEVIGASRRYDGPMGKSDRAFVFSVLALCGAFGLSNSFLITIILSITLMLIVVNTGIRVRRAIKEAEDLAV